MLRSIWEDVRREFGYGNMIARIIIINCAVFVTIHLINFFLFIGNGGEPSPFFDKMTDFFCMSSDWRYVLRHPWTPITSIFLHVGFWHILWNMLILYWFGRIVADFIGNHRILPIYILGGLVGGFFFFLSANVMAYGQGEPRFALGASAGVMAMVVSAATIAPDYYMRLLFLGDVKLKYIALVMIFLDLVLIAQNVNTGGHFAHLGGALFGFIFVRQLQQGNDFSLPFNNLIDRLNAFFQSLFNKSTPRKGPQVVYRNPTRVASRTRQSRKGYSKTDNEDLSYQEKLDAILDKIKQTGYESLSEKEKEFLFNASKK
jgi:membrane associated rhomboid family serine protease